MYIIFRIVDNKMKILIHHPRPYKRAELTACHISYQHHTWTCHLDVTTCIARAVVNAHWLCTPALHWCFMAILSDPLSLDMFLCFHLWCHAAISLAERGASRSTAIILFPGGNEYPSCSTGYREGPVFSFINSDGTRQAPIFSSQVKIDFILAIRGPKGIFGARGGWERLSWYLTGPTFDIWAGLTTASSEWFNQAFTFVFLLNSLCTV